MELKLADRDDIDSWMRLVETVKEGFPGLETQEALEEHRNTVLEFMARSAAICAKENGIVLGALLFSKEENVLCFLAVAPEYRRRHIAGDMVRYMLRLLDPVRDVTVTTYREGVPEGEAARKFYKKLGFQEGELTEEFGAPVQIFVLKR